MEYSTYLRNLGRHHLNSFNYVVNTGLRNVYCNIDPIFVDENIKVSISDATLDKLQYPMDLRYHKRKVYPSEAKQRSCTYLAEFCVKVRIEQNDSQIDIDRTFYIPAMVKSCLCYLNDMDDRQLIAVKEDLHDPGGYFIINGKQRVIRNFTVSLRNYPLVLSKTVWKTYGQNYSELGVLIRSVKDEHLFSNVSLHFVTTGSFEVRLYCNSSPYQINAVLLMKALADKTDLFICKELSKFNEEFPINWLKNAMHKLQIEGVSNHLAAKGYIGALFLPVLNLPPDSTPEDACNYIIKKCFLTHLDSFEDKFQFLCYSLCKLHSVIVGKCRLDDQDNPVYQEILNPGQICMLALKKGLITYLHSVRNVIKKAVQRKAFKFYPDYLVQCCNRAIPAHYEMRTMITSGNFAGKPEYGLPSSTGYSVPLKRGNAFQLAAHFSAICKFSMKHYSKNQRKLYPESWGFLCPTQTPEGENTGLYNHLAEKCKVLEMNAEKLNINILNRLGILPCNDPSVYICQNKCFLLVDGLVCGWVHSHSGLCTKLKLLRSKSLIPEHSEIICLNSQDFFPGIFLLSSPCRLIRSFERNSREDLIGIFEQATLGLCTDGNDSDIYSEINDHTFLSLSAAMIPFCENNFGIRNIFSSVKCKQGVGVLDLNLNGQSDSKASRLVYGQSPSVTTTTYLDSGFYLYPHGVNVVVALLSYSGFDMEDAVVLNKSSVERGLMHHVVFESELYELDQLAQECHCNPSDLEFKRDESDPYISHFLDRDGFPYVGSIIRQGKPVLSIYNKKGKSFIIKHYLQRESAYVYNFKLMGDIPAYSNIPKNSKKVCITYVSRKIPAVGDKFSDRHGDKGICSFIMPSEDLPVSENGIVPDILFNPHALSTRMAVGMLFEILSGKLCNTRGKRYVVEPFRIGKTETYESIGSALEEAGMNFHGTEKFYSGTSGEELEADVFSGCMYYMRFHHYVAEKYQVSSMGLVEEKDEKTNQPRNISRSGAIRVGEMEKDAILSHGAMEVLQDRLLHCSDECSAFLCSKCSLLIYPVLHSPSSILEGGTLEENRFCCNCSKESDFRVKIPFVLAYLVAELAVMGIKVKLAQK